MARVSSVINFERIFVWRSLKRSHLWGSDAALPMILLIWAITRLYAQVAAARLVLINGRTGPADFLLAGVQMAWVVAGLMAKTPEIPWRFLQFPLSRADLLLFRAARALCSPYVWALFLVSILSFQVFPPQVRNAGFYASCGAFTTWCFMSGISAGVLMDGLSAHRGWRLVWWMGAALVTGATGLWWLLAPWGPQQIFRFLVMALRPGAAVGVFLSGSAGLGLLVLVSVRRAQITRLGASGSFPGAYVGQLRFGVLPEALLKDLRLITRHLEPWIALVFTLPGLAYFLWDPRPHPLALAGGALVVMALIGPLTLNSFGLENRRAITRYRILPVPGIVWIKSKNMAFFSLIGFLLAPMFLVGGIRLGALKAMTVALVSAMMGLLYSMCGNEIAIRFPHKCRSYHLTAFGFETGIGHVLLTHLICCAPGALLLQTGRVDSKLLALAASVGCAYLVSLYRRHIVRQGHLLDRFLKFGHGFATLRP